MRDIISIILTLLGFVCMVVGSFLLVKGCYSMCISPYVIGIICFVAEHFIDDE